MQSEDARKVIAKLIATNHRVSPAELAKAAGVSRQRIHQLLVEMGYRQDCMWKRDTPKKGRGR